MTASSCSQPTTPEPQKMGKGLIEGGNRNSHSRMLGDSQNVRPGTFWKCSEPTLSQGANSALCRLGDGGGGLQQRWEPEERNGLQVEDEAAS